MLSAVTPDDSFPKTVALPNTVSAPTRTATSAGRTDLPPKNRTEHRVRESVQVREKGERNEQAEAVRS